MNCLGLTKKVRFLGIFERPIPKVNPRLRCSISNLSEMFCSVKNAPIYRDSKDQGAKYKPSKWYGVALLSKSISSNLLDHTQR